MADELAPPPTPPAPRPAWFAARTRNALRRTGMLGAIGVPVFIATLLALVLVPRQAMRTAQATQPAGTRPDTTAPLARLERERRLTLAADSLMQVARTAAAQRTRVVVAAPSLPPGLARTRDSLAAASASLGRLITRAQNAPLPASYRALGETRELAGEPRVRSLLDSLGAIERARDAFDAVGGVDPVFVTLTARVTAIGRDLVAIAAERRSEIRRQLNVIAATATASSAVVADADSMTAEGDGTEPGTSAGRTVVYTRSRVDTVGPAERLASAALDSTRAAAAVTLARRRADEYDRRAESARAVANFTAPPVALLGASLVLGIVVAFGTTLGAELRRPRVADVTEAERMTGARVLTTIGPEGDRVDQYGIRPGGADRGRRRSDSRLPSLIDTTAESYRMLYLHFAATGASVPLVTVTGDDPAITATVASNLAVSSAVEARSTLLVDGDLESGAVAAVFQVRPEPGLAGVLGSRVDWAGSIVPVPVGRDGTLDLVPSGVPAAGRTEVSSEARGHLARLAARYDLAVLVAPPPRDIRSTATLLPLPDVLLCARVGHTGLAALAQAAARLRGGGARLRGVVLWDAETPSLPAREALAASRKAPTRETPREVAAV